MSTVSLSPADEFDFAGNDRFEVRRRIVEGAFGVVYEAFDRERTSAVPLKALRRAQGDFLVRFKGEFRALADIAHPNLVSLYELFCDHDSWFFTMELVHGCEVLEYLAPGKEGTFAGDEETTEIRQRGGVVTLSEAPLPSSPPPGEPFDPHFGRLRKVLPQLARGLEHGLDPAERELRHRGHGHVLRLGGDPERVIDQHLAITRTSTVAPPDEGCWYLAKSGATDDGFTGEPSHARRMTRRAPRSYTSPVKSVRKGFPASLGSLPPYTNALLRPTISSVPTADWQSQQLVHQDLSKELAAAPVVPDDVVC